MIIYSVCSFVLVLLASAVIYCISGGAGIPIFFSNPALIAVFPLAAVMILAVSGSLKDFAVIFLPRKKIGELSLSGLKKAHEAVGLVIVTELIVGLGILCMAVVVLLYNWNRLDYAGPNLGVAIEAPFFALILTLILLPLQAGLKKKIVSFMEEKKETAAVSAACRNTEKQHTLLKTVLCSLSFILIFGCVYFIILKNDKDIPVPFDMPSLLVLAIFTGIALGCSGNFGNFLRIFTVSALNTDTSPAILNQLADTVDLIIKTVLCAGTFAALISAEMFLYHLGDTSYLAANVYVSLLCLLYAVVFSLVLLPVRMSFKKRAAQRINTYEQK